MLLVAGSRSVSPTPVCLWLAGICERANCNRTELTSALAHSRVRSVVRCPSCVVRAQKQRRPATSKSLLAIIMEPTRELAQQVGVLFVLFVPFGRCAKLFAACRVLVSLAGRVVFWLAVRVDALPSPPRRAFFLADVWAGALVRLSSLLLRQVYQEVSKFKKYLKDPAISHELFIGGGGELLYFVFVFLTSVA
jgi:hypothetical protein